MSRIVIFYTYIRNTGWNFLTTPGGNVGPTLNTGEKQFYSKETFLYVLKEAKLKDF